VIEDTTADLKTKLGGDISATLRALQSLESHFDRETISAALGEISEKLIEKFTDSDRMPRGNKGFDIISKKR
jgi:hypothetical protein